MECNNVNEFLEDIFLKGEIPKTKDPFVNKNDLKGRKDDNVKTSDLSYDSAATSASLFRGNPVKYSRLPNGMILNHDKESLRK